MLDPRVVHQHRDIPRDQVSFACFIESHAENLWAIPDCARRKGRGQLFQLELLKVLKAHLQDGDPVKRRRQMWPHQTLVANASCRLNGVFHAR